ncbi:AbrB/MazE/SpoVT family DNA-binding domain-containing protein [Patescibacteria group bacterium]|nr:AbrB/MazE/SpoVT family DNA-binding domain-containing protein [Patescibacteria group bacterium]MBU1867886.1 AbrB/MazE/SpoVT family DNA-binding domain-containing protein [Patescibacteria group bacterium]
MSKTRTAKLSQQQKVFKAGNSLVLVVPSRFKNSLGIKSGDLVKVKADLTKQTLTYRFPHQRQLTLLQKKSTK